MASLCYLARGPGDKALQECNLSTEPSMDCSDCIPPGSGKLSDRVFTFLGCLCKPRSKRKTHRPSRPSGRYFPWITHKLCYRPKLTKRDIDAVKEVRKLSVLHISPSSGQQAVFCPILLAIVYLMMEYPLRTHHVRWLDSGELDAQHYDFLERKFVTNPNCSDISRAYGVLQPGGGAVAADDLTLDFQVAINKVQLGERLRSNFTIPYVTPDVLWVLEQVLEWQTQYGASPKVVKETDEPALRKNRNQRIQEFYPEICPLFRYPEQAGYFPPAHNQLTYFWGQLCGVWDKLKGTPILSRVVSRRSRKNLIEAIYDLHSLRVAGPVCRGRYQPSNCRF